MRIVLRIYQHGWVKLDKEFEDIVDLRNFLYKNKEKLEKLEEGK